MPELTLEALARRVADLEQKVTALSAAPAKGDWRVLVGSMADNEFTRQWRCEMEAIREADREAARAGRNEDQP